MTSNYEIGEAATKAYSEMDYHWQTFALFAGIWNPDTNYWNSPAELTKSSSEDVSTAINHLMLAHTFAGKVLGLSDLYAPNTAAETESVMIMRTNAEYVHVVLSAGIEKLLLQREELGQNRSSLPRWRKLFL